MTSRHAMTVALALAALALVAAFAGCGAAKKSEPLDRGLQRYNEALRWQRIAEAAQYVPPPERDEFFNQRLEMEDELRITQYDVRRVDRGQSDDHAIAYVQYSWYLDREGRVYQTTTEQHWQRHGDTWLVVSEERSHGEAMPGVPEPALDDELEEDDDADEADDDDEDGGTASAGSRH